MVENDAIQISEYPIFIVGLARSGTTILRLMIECHPNISTAFETGFLTEFEKLERRWRKQVQSLGFDRPYWLERTREFYGRFHADRARRKGCQRWCEKSPDYVMHLDFVTEVFPGARIIHIVRDGRAVVQSHAQRWGLRRAVRAASKWGEGIDAARAFALKHPEQYFEMQYEDLVHDTEAVMRRLLDFVGEPWDPAVLSPYEQIQPSKGLRAKHRTLAEEEGSKGVHTQGLASGETLNPVLRQLLYRRSGDQMRLLNYR